MDFPLKHIHAGLWMGCILLGSLYLLLPLYVFSILLALALIFGVGIIKPQYTFLMILLFMIEELSQLFFTFRTKPGMTYTVRYFVYVIPLMATLLGLAVAIVREQRDIRKTPIDILLLLIVIYELISVLWMPHTIMASLVFFNLLLNFLFFLAITNMVTGEDMLRLVVKVLIVTGMVNTSGIIASMWVGGTEEVWMSRTWGFVFEFSAHNMRPSGFGGANHAAAFSNLGIFLALGSMLWESGRKMKWLYFGCAAYMTAGVILTQSRGALFGLVGALVFFVLIKINFRGRRIRALVTVIFLVIFMMLAVKPALFERIMLGFGYTGELYFSKKSFYAGQSVSESGHQGSLSGLDIRKVWWMNALREMIDNPAKLIFGLGCGGYLYYAKGSPEVNSIYFAFFYDMGVFGIVIFMLLAAVIVSTLRAQLMKPEETYSRAMLPAMVGAITAIIGIHGLIEFDLSAFGTKNIWLPLALTMAVLNIIREESATYKERGGERRRAAYVVQHGT